MNNKIQRFTTQLSEAAPIAPDLESGTRTVVPRPSIMAVRLGLVAVVLALVGVVTVTVGNDSERAAVVPASAATDPVAVIREVVADVLPADFRVVVVESLDVRSGHVVAVSDRLEVLDIQFKTESPSQEIAGTEAPNTEAPVDLLCVAPVSTPDSSECLQYADEATGTMNAPTTSNPMSQPQCYTVGNPQASVNVQDSSPTTSMPCSLEKLENQEIPVSNECTVYVNSGSEVPPPTPQCSQVVVIVENTVPSDVLSAENSFSNGADPEPMVEKVLFDGVYVEVNLFALDRQVDVASLVDALSVRIDAIDDLGRVIESLPRATTPDPLFGATPSPEGSWNGRGVTTGSLSVLLGKNSENGAVVIQMRFPGSLELSGHDGEMFWHATTVDGSVSIALFQRGDRATMTDEDTKALVRKIAEGWVDETAAALASPESNDTSPPMTEAPVDTATP